MPILHLLITQQNDYLTEIPLFFYNNHENFARNGVFIPWLTISREGFARQGELLKHAQNLADNKVDESSYLKQELARYNHLLFMGAAGDLIGAKRIGEFIRNDKLARWDDFSIHCVWLANPKSLDVEGAFRNIPSMRCAESLYASLQKDPALNLAYIEDLLDFADSVTILPESDYNHIDASTLLDALKLPFDASGLVPIENNRLYSRELSWVARKLASAGIGRKVIANALKPLDVDTPDPFLDAAKLDLFDSVYEKGMEKIASRFGVDLKLPRPFANISHWQPFVEPARERIEELTETVLASLPEEREFKSYVLKHTARTIFNDLRLAGEPESPAFLSVLTLTKNHEKYIGECVESVARQKTDFPKRHIIVDDISTDNTRRLIWQYAQKYSHIEPIFMNADRKPGENVRTLFEACKSAYAALCDGDDYFTDTLKLQKQVDFLENHPQCAMCFHPVDVLYEDGSPSRVYPPPDMLPGGEKSIYTLKDLLSGNIIQTNSVVYRWRFKDGVPPWFAATLIPGDWYWHILHAELGAIGYLPEHMGVYRRHPASLYAQAETGHTAHRAVHGMKELELYDTLDRHFKRRKQEAFFRFANGVFADFTRIYAQTGDDSALTEACERFPVFGKRFLRELKIN